MKASQLAEALTEFVRQQGDMEVQDAEGNEFTDDLDMLVDSDENVLVLASKWQ
jgi:hypothetical protein